MVDIGVLEEAVAWRLHPRFFPSKVGGKPSWLDLTNLPNPKDLTCKRCEYPLVFLCQIYAPYEDSDDCFHRTIFIFICPNGPCCQTNCADNFIVLRCQLQRRNNYYSFEPYKEKDEEFPMDKWPKLCILCGMKGPSHCSKCKKRFYCSRHHQILDWQKGHKQECRELQTKDSIKSYNFEVTEAGSSLLFKEWELIVDEEDQEEVKDVDVNQEMNKLRQLMQEKKAGTLENVSESELEEYTTRTLPDDKVFNKFSKRVARHPDQVLRYSRGGDPLWITGNTGNVVAHVPNCQYCGGERQFEFQVMPQLLNFINVGIDVNSIDWGVLAVYTCKQSCNMGPAYKEEHIIKQDLNN